jgi:hypothetical protein
MQHFNCPHAQNCELMPQTFNSICEIGHYWESEHTSVISKILESNLSPEEKLVAAYLFRHVGAGCDPQCVHDKKDIVQKISEKMHIPAENVLIVIGKFYLKGFIQDTAKDQIFVNMRNIWIEVRKGS